MNQTLKEQTTEDIKENVRYMGLMSEDISNILTREQIIYLCYKLMGELNAKKEG